MLPHLTLQEPAAAAQVKNPRAQLRTRAASIRLHSKDHRKGARASSSLQHWYDTLNDDSVHLSVLVVGELTRGVERIKRRDPVSARKLEAWLKGVVADFEDRVLPVTEPIARAWGTFGVPDPVPTVDGLLAATAHVHGLVLVTRNTKDAYSTGVELLNPFVEA
ncbi:MAG: type II toxin-antitoxin system VapC family toxin [Myxococcota bacterium]